MSETVSLDFEFACAPERVWSALTDPVQMSEWMFFESEGFEPRVGTHFQFRGKASTGWNGVVDCEVLVLEEGRRLSYSWVTEGQPGPHRTVVTWTLVDNAKGGTRLHLEQSGFDPEAKQEIGGAKYGWTHQLNQLKAQISPDNVNE